jgi:hypothetical protein
MKIYVTNYSAKILDSGIHRTIYVHYRKDCQKLRADFKTEIDSLPNSGIQERSLEGKEELFEMLKALGKFTICKECQNTGIVQSYDRLNSYNTNDETFLREAVAEYDKLIEKGNE